MFRKSLAVVIAAAITVAGAPVAVAASPQPGKKCSVAGQTSISGNKMYTCVTNSKKKPKRVWNSGSTATDMRRAYTKCKLWKTNDLGKYAKFSSLEDGGKTLTMDSVGKFTIIDTGASVLDMFCVLDQLKAPSFVESQISNTRAIDGMQEASWGKFRAFWNYHPDDGASITFTSLR